MKHLTGSTGSAPCCASSSAISSSQNLTRPSVKSCQTAARTPSREVVPHQSWLLHSSRFGNYSAFRVKRRWKLKSSKRQWSTVSREQWIAHAPLLNSTGQLRRERVAGAAVTADKHAADWQGRRGNRRNDEADAEILSNIIDIIRDMPGYGYRRVWGILRKQRCTEGLSPVNARRLYRIMSEHNLLLLHDKPEQPKREHKGKIAVAESDMRWVFRCDNGEKLRGSRSRWTAVTARP